MCGTEGRDPGQEEKNLVEVLQEIARFQWWTFKNELKKGGKAMPILRHFPYPLLKTEGHFYFEIKETKQNLLKWVATFNGTIKKIKK